MKYIDFCEPEMYEEAMQVYSKKEWKQGIKEEIDSMSQNHIGAMRDLGSAKQINMCITRDMKKQNLILSWSDSIKKVL